MQAATRRQRITTSPASQRRTRTSKPYLCVGVMEREKWSLRDGEESIRGGKIPPPLEPAPPLTPIGTPVTPNLPRAGGPGPSRPGPMAARGGPPDPTAEEKLPHPIIQSVPKLHKTIRHPGKARLPRLYWTPPPCGGTDASKTPTPEPGPSACTNPCSRRHTNQDPSPPGPAVTPTRRQSAPRSPNPPPDQPRNSAAARLATYVRRHRHPQQRRMPPPEKQHPRVTNTPSRPRPQPQRRTPQETHPQGTPRCPRPILPPHANNKNHSRTESGPPPTLGDGADQRSPERLI